MIFRLRRVRRDAIFNLIGCTVQNAAVAHIPVEPRFGIIDGLDGRGAVDTRMPSPGGEFLGQLFCTPRPQVEVRPIFALGNRLL